MTATELVGRLSAGGGVDALLCGVGDAVTPDVIRAGGRRLKVISTTGVSTANIDTAAASAAGVVIASVPDVLTDTVADLVVGLVIAVARRFKEGIAAADAGRTSRRSLPGGGVGVDVHGATVGIIGFGAVGAAVARRLSGFDVSFVYTGPRKKVGGPAADVGARYVGLNHLLAVSDIVLPLCPVTDDTRGMFDWEAMERMKKTAVLVNGASAALMDVEAIYYAVKTGEIAGAGMCVPEGSGRDAWDTGSVPSAAPGGAARQKMLMQKLLGLPTVTVLPDMAGETVGCLEDMAAMAAGNLMAALRGKRLPHVGVGDGTDPPSG
ncbi:hypothetical protein BU14_0027s0044 [Porphyra umbilicalis]|uniref:D-isomer specific 2-hydroxyacid dehydrogenase NAD-binding domain-containing protein n=1 Tax=Porphyra umbilicalis TaxID=2786 RepID=A0A1X6PJX9_PORUM|nr:hypothetical protein BU14_0027s0044 [Porphyra umbilicalis]|eukprot:OSX81018.1 hypothetical protein BU14_0027s0044 [Porphyra umbilicalis]